MEKEGRIVCRPLKRLATHREIACRRAVSVSRGIRFLEKSVTLKRKCICALGSCAVSVSNSCVYPSSKFARPRCVVGRSGPERYVVETFC